VETDEELARRFGFPVFPLWNGMSLHETSSDDLLQWLFTYGTFYNYFGTIQKGLDYYWIKREGDTLSFDTYLRQKVL
jgi:hypothetical protein